MMYFDIILDPFIDSLFIIIISCLIIILLIEMSSIYFTDIIIVIHSSPSFYAYSIHLLIIYLHYL